MDLPPRYLRNNPFLDKVRSFLRLRGMAYKTEKTYLFWIKRFIRFHSLRHQAAGVRSPVDEGF
ncbi:phage integrase N-terminal SAM-like domain-containing protein [Marinobacter sediminum]|uniref:phage integrase N-terminal SAM-like domain-containing protein n=1 Tax=Marinobacter sediminum TaxID=256323 RepID=UPI0025480C96|nr:phage integrase N-terminal SAM-like domain-containing protein [Marinobacter sediminum]